MGGVRGGGVRDTKKNYHPSEEKGERFKARNGRKIGTLPRKEIEETGKTRVNASNKEQKRAVKSWRLQSPIRRWRIANNLTIEEARAILDIPLTTYQNWEYGRYGIPETVKVGGEKYKFNEKLAPIVGFTRHVHNKWFKKKPKPVLQAKSIRGKFDE